MQNDPYDNHKFRASPTPDGQHQIRDTRRCLDADCYKVKQLRESIPVKLVRRLSSAETESRTSSTACAAQYHACIGTRVYGGRLILLRYMRSIAIDQREAPSREIDHKSTLNAVWHVIATSPLIVNAHATVPQPPDLAQSSHSC